MQLILIFSLLIIAVNAHTRVFFAGEKKEDCVRPIGSPNKNFPIKDVRSGDMTCGLGGTKAAKSQCAVQAGSTFNLQYGHNSPGDDVMATSHKGPCNVYLVPVDGYGNAPRDGWIKILQPDMNGKWCTENIISNKGKFSIPIPSSAPSGKYILRTELAALHEANRPGANQFYVNCLDIVINGGAAGNNKAKRANNEGTVSIPGHLDPKSPGVVYDIYKNKTPKNYPTLGPPVNFAFAGGSSGKTKKTKKTVKF
jgi:lytic cellulose monooxygenase (C1-hydroxylating)